MLTSTRTRFPINPDGKSGHMTLQLPDLVQDTTNRAALAAADTAAYLASGGKQRGKELTFAQKEEEYIRQLTDTTDVNTFLGL